MSEPVIQVEDVRYSYPFARALAGLSLSVEKGSAVGLRGPTAPARPP